MEYGYIFNTPCYSQFFFTKSHLVLIETEVLLTSEGVARADGGNVTSHKLDIIQGYVAPLPIHPTLKHYLHVVNPPNVYLRSLPPGTALREGAVPYLREGGGG